MKKQICFAAVLLTLLSAAPAIAAHAEDTPQISAGWHTLESGRRFYIHEDGSTATGETVIDGVTYLFSAEGLQRTGWQTVGGLRYYYDAEGNACFGWVHWRDADYYVSEEKGKLTGTAEMEDGKRFFDEYGVVQIGMFLAEDQWLYTDETGLLASGEHNFDGQPYLFDADGRLLTGWQTAADGITRYYDAETGQIRTGWIHIGEEEFYADPEKGRLTGAQTVGERQYCFGEDGVLQKGICCADGVWVYADSYGVIGTFKGETAYDGGIAIVGEGSAVQTGFQTASDGVLRYFDPVSGKFLTGWIRTDSGTYYMSDENTLLTGVQRMDDAGYCFDENGVMQTGWIRLEDVSYYADENGVFVTGWQNIDGKDYYFTEDGTLATGAVKIGDLPTIFDAEGSLAVGWYFTADGYGYYCEEAGVPVTGKQKIDGSIYDFSDEGKLLNTVLVIDGETMLFLEDGKYVTGWYTDAAGKKYYYSAEGRMCKGWQTIGNAMYYFGEEDGVLAVSTTIDDFTIDENGVAKNANAIIADAQIAAAGNTASAVYKAFVSRYRYSKIENTRTYAQLKAAGWESLITYLLANKRGVCYYLAAGLDFFYHRMGFTTRMVHATHDTGDHYWVQVLTASGWLNFDPTYNNRCAITWSDIIARGNYTVYGYIDITYDRRGAYVSETYTKYTAS